MTAVLIFAVAGWLAFLWVALGRGGTVAAWARTRADREWFEAEVGEYRKLFEESMQARRQMTRDQWKFLAVIRNILTRYPVTAAYIHEQLAEHLATPEASDVVEDSEIS